MKIALVCTTTFTCPPEKYGGEIYVHWLCNALCDLGHEVVLFAAYGSTKPRRGKLIPLRLAIPGDWRHMLDTEDDIIKYHTDELRNVDVVHDFSHNDQIGKWCKENNVPHCNTLWGISYMGTCLTGHFVRDNVVTWSRIHREIGLWTPEQLASSPYGQWHPYSESILPTTKVVLGGVDTAQYHMDLSVDREDWFLFLARAHPSKGVDTVLEIARRNPDMEIKMAGSYSGLHKSDGDMYKTMAEELPNIEIIGDVDADKKLELYQRCKAFLFPVQYAEAFGIVVCEAMSTGAPLIVSDRGSMPELIENGVNGFICTDIEHYENAMRTIKYIDPVTVRRYCLDNFSMRRVAFDYLRVYKATINGEKW